VNISEVFKSESQRLLIMVSFEYKYFIFGYVNIRIHYRSHINKGALTLSFVVHT